MPNRSIGARFTEIRLDIGERSATAMSKRLGIGVNAWKGYEEGQGTPSWATLEKLVALGYDPTWLMTGSGSMKLAGGPSKPVSVDPELFGRLVSAVAAAHKDAGISLPDGRLGQIAAEIFADLTTAAEGPEEYPEQMHIMIKRLKKRLQSALAEPGTGKRSA
ncbi:helix-turn-helix domain-containing protein [Azorhizobium doebereinerae]|uniref:helix-turn-helix domain-containing protein n=1 Tax=Azorhizobium doebereinerae TaxID=281091 RepID=UPI00049097D8|nr:helix-turn-helix transcriptional regulator [Azorhizobium doebereinerae]